MKMLYLFYDCLWNELNESYNLFHKVQDKLQSTKKNIPGNFSTNSYECTKLFHNV